MASQEEKVITLLQQAGQPTAKQELMRLGDLKAKQLDPVLARLKQRKEVWKDLDGLWRLGHEPDLPPDTVESPAGEVQSPPEVAPRVVQGAPAAAPRVVPEVGAPYIPPPATGETMETTHASMYLQFMDLGKLLGIDTGLLQVTTDHVFQGGDYKDIAWVWEALTQVNIRPDMRDRWFHSWRSRLGQPFPPQMSGYSYAGYPSSMQATQDRPDLKAPSKDYIIDADMPVRVAGGTGDFTFEEVERVLSIKARGKSAPQQPAAQPMTMKDVTELVRLFQGQDSRGKHYVVTPTADGTVVQEVADGQPVIVGTTGPPPAVTKIVDRDTGEMVEVPPGEAVLLTPRQQASPSTIVVGPDGQTQEVPLGKPIIINQPPPPQTQPAHTWVIGPDGSKQKVEAGEPIIIQAAPQRGDGTTPMIMQMRDEQGNPLQMDVQSLLALRRFEGEEKRAGEKHGALISTLGQIRKELPMAIKAYAATANQRAQLQGPPQQLPQPAPGQVAYEQPPQHTACPQCAQAINVAGMQAGDHECPHCQAPFTLRFEPRPIEMAEQETEG